MIKTLFAGISPYLLQIAGVALLLVSSFAGIQTYRLHSAQTKVVKVQVDAAICEANTGALTGAVEEQNKAAQGLAKDASKDAASASARAEKVYKQQPPATSPGVEELNKWLDTFDK